MVQYLPFTVPDAYTSLFFVIMNFPPFWTFCGMRLLKKHHLITTPNFLIAVFSTMMVGLTYFWINGGLQSTFIVAAPNGAHFHYPYIAAVLYLGTFLFFAMWTKLYAYDLKRFVHPAIAFALSIFAVYSVAELWELPIHLFNWFTTLDQFVSGAILAAPKLISIPLYFYFLHRSGWKPDMIFLLLLSTTLIWGGLMYAIMWEGPSAVIANYYLFHLSRVGWIAIFMWAFMQTPKEKLR